jgi:hypothetical protein
VTQLADRLKAHVLHDSGVDVTPLVPPELPSRWYYGIGGMFDVLLELGPRVVGRRSPFELNTSAYQLQTQMLTGSRQEYATSSTQQAKFTVARPSFHHTICSTS